MRRRQCRRAKAKKVDAFVLAESSQQTQYKSQAFHAGDEGKGKGRGKERVEERLKTSNMWLSQFMATARSSMYHFIG